MPSVVAPGPLLRLLVPVLLVLGLVGMHGLVGGTAGGGHASLDSAAAAVVAPAPGAHTGGGVAGHSGHLDPIGGTAPDGHVHLVELCLAVLGGLLAAVLVRAVVGMVRGTSGPADRALIPSGLLPRAPDLRALQVSRT